MSGAAAGAVMVARHGPRQMAGSAVVGGVLLGLIEGMSKHLFDFVVSRMQKYIFFTIVVGDFEYPNKLSGSGALSKGWI